MVTSTKNKTGRPIAVYHPTFPSDPIPGLMRLKDGRWRASGPDRYTFTERDEKLAIAHYLQWKAKRSAFNLGTVKVHTSAEEAMIDMARRTIEAGGSLQANVAMPSEGPKTYTVTDHSLRPEQWVWLREQLLTRRTWVAQMVGVEQIGWLTDLKRPTPSPTLDEVGKLYLDNAKISDNWRAKCKAFWAEFTKAVEVPKLRDIEQEHIIDYADMMHEAAQTPTYVRQRFGAVKAIINYPTKRGKWAEDAKRVLTYCSVLVPPKKSATDPNPISSEDFHKLYTKADIQMKAALMLGLNAAMYAGEVAALNWSDLDLSKGVLCTERSKTRITRVAMLWPQTIAVLQKLPRKAQPLFVTEAGTQADYLCIYRMFKTTRNAAELDIVQFSQIRDGAYTAAVEAGTDLNICRLLAGHAIGISDHYVKRRPTMVASACDAVGAAYKIDQLKG
jgi:integrase